MVPKQFSGFCLALTCQFAADRLAAAAGVDARFTLAVQTLTFGPLAVWTLVPSDTCHPRHWSLSALVTVGAGWCEKPLDQPIDPTLDEIAGSPLKPIAWRPLLRQFRTARRTKLPPFAPDIC